MEDFLNLTLKNSGEPVYINVEQIAFIHKDGDATLICFAANYVKVAESVEEVLKRIEIFANSF